MTVVDAVAQQLPGHGQTVCVTGAAGYIASWLVKLLLERGYTVKGTVRNPDDPKNAHLKALDGAAERLILCKADLLDYDAICAAVEGCHGVFHTASPVTDDPEQMMEPAVRGTEYVINAAADAGTVRRVVFTSSIGAVTMDPNRGPDVVVDESCWSDLEFSIRIRKSLCYHIMVPVRCISACCRRHRAMPRSCGEPELVLLRQSRGGAGRVGGGQQARYRPRRREPRASGRATAAADGERQRCAHPQVPRRLGQEVRQRRAVVRGRARRRQRTHPRVRGARGLRPVPLRRARAAPRGRRPHPQQALPRVPTDASSLVTCGMVVLRCSDEVNPRKQPYKMSNQKLQDLGLQFTPVNDSLYETVKSLQEKGHLVVPSKDTLAELNNVKA